MPTEIIGSKAMCKLGIELVMAFSSGRSPEQSVAVALVLETALGVLMIPLKRFPQLEYHPKTCNSESAPHCQDTDGWKMAEGWLDEATSISPDLGLAVALTRQLTPSPMRDEANIGNALRDTC
jgi:hypothetical protein